MASRTFNWAGADPEIFERVGPNIILSKIYFKPVAKLDSRIKQSLNLRYDRGVRIPSDPPPGSATAALQYAILDMGWLSE